MQLKVNYFNMKITKEYLGKGCDKVEWNAGCGDWSLKHNEYYYCENCFSKLNLKNEK